MKAKILAIAVVLVSAGVAAMPVSAHEGHGSCEAFGETVSANAQSDPPWGQIVSHGAQLGWTSALTEEAHTVEGLCETRP